MKTWSFEDTHPTSEGPWQDEPDKVQWIDEETNLDCLLVRNFVGAWCGYVGVPSTHPLHGVKYEVVEELMSLDVHGGLTFSDKCHEGGKICHVPEAGRPDDVWWLGFDCHHVFDLGPKMVERLREVGEPKDSILFKDAIYRDMDYAMNECRRLAKQLKELSS